MSRAPRYGIAEWYGDPFLALTPAGRARTAERALGESHPPCPFREGPCRKEHGVCSIGRYVEETGEDGRGTGRIGSADRDPVVVCPVRFEEGQVLIRWLAEIVGIRPGEVMMAREVPFMRSTNTGKPAGMIDLVVARKPNGDLRWYGMEIQAVYFSGVGMGSEVEAQIGAADDERPPPFPGAVRRPDWRSSSAKRLMPQLEVKVPLLRQWGAKTAVVVDRPFFEAIGGPSPAPSRDLSSGDVIWMVPELRRAGDGRYRLTRGHWEVLKLEDTRSKLLAATDVPLQEFEKGLLDKLEPLA